MRLSSFFVVTLLVTWIFLTQCAHRRQLLISAPYISLLENRPPPHQLQKGSYTMVSWCPGEKVNNVPEDSGAIDTLLAKAHASTKSQYFLEATIYAQEDCLNLRGFTVVPKP